MDSGGATQQEKTIKQPYLSGAANVNNVKYEIL
jgi:hypothetical protein